MEDIYKIGRILNPFSWGQPDPEPQAPRPAPVPIGAPPPNPYVPEALLPGPNLSQFTMPMADRPAPPIPGNIRQPIYPQPIRPPMTAPANVDNPAELIRLRKLAVESGDWRAPLGTVKGNYQAKNPETSASGAYQYINGTWKNYGGYPEARLAPKHIQDARAREDIARELKKFNGDPFKVFANHMLPVQANRPDLWDQPSTLKGEGGKLIKIPPVLDYVRKSVAGTPYESQLDAYIAAHKTR